MKALNRIVTVVKANKSHFIVWNKWQPKIGKNKLFHTNKFTNKMRFTIKNKKNYCKELNNTTLTENLPNDKADIFWFKFDKKKSTKI